MVVGWRCCGKGRRAGCTGESTCVGGSLSIARWGCGRGHSPAVAAAAAAGARWGCGAARRARPPRTARARSPTPCGTAAAGRRRGTTTAGRKCYDV